VLGRKVRISAQLPKKHFVLTHPQKLFILRPSKNRIIYETY